MVLLACLAVNVPSQQTTTTFCPSGFEQPPRDKRFNNNGTHTRKLTTGVGSETEALCAAIDAAAFYASQHPKFIPAATAIRDVKDKDRFRRTPGFVPKKGQARYKTLPDFITPGLGGRCEPPGAKTPGGWILPPNTVLISDNELDGDGKTNPLKGCWEYAQAIMVFIHEGQRMFQRGSMLDDQKMEDWDCRFLSDIAKVYKGDVEILDDFIGSGQVQLPPSHPAAPYCTLTARNIAQLKVARVDAKKTLDAICAARAKKNCPPIPECQ